MEQQQEPAAVAAVSVESALKGLSLGAKQQPSEAAGASASAAVPAAKATEVEAVSGGDVADAKDQLIHTLTEELIKAKADLARISKERCVLACIVLACACEPRTMNHNSRSTPDHWHQSTHSEYYKRRAEWATTADPQILSPVLTSADQWHDRTWLMLHEPIRQALVDFDDLVKSPSFDPVAFPWKVCFIF